MHEPHPNLQATTTSSRNSPGLQGTGIQSILESAYVGQDEERMAADHSTSHRKLAAFHLTCIDICIFAAALAQE